MGKRTRLWLDLPDKERERIFQTRGEREMDKYLEEFSNSARKTFAQWIRTKEWDKTGLFLEPEVTEEGKDSDPEDEWADILEAIGKFNETRDLRYLNEVTEEELIEVMNPDPDDLAVCAWQLAWDTEDDHAILEFLIETLDRLQPEYHLPILKYVYERAEGGH